jgi:shikimate kinase
MSIRSLGNIFLTGFMGSGKTTVGKKLAKLLRVNFVDLDYYIEQKEKLSVQSLFDNFGEAAFRKMERSCLDELLLNEKNTVIALGGGTICHENNLENIKKNGLLVYIELPPIALAQRLEKSKVKRPLLKNFKDEELVSFVSHKLQERKTYYDQSNIIVSGLSLTPQLLQQKISEYKK